MREYSHRIEIYEPYEYDGQNPLLLYSEGVLVTPDRKEAVLLALDERILVDGEDYKFIVVRPKYADPIARVTESNCTVMISLVRPDRQVEAGEQYQYADILNWGVGKINQYGVLNGA